MLIPHEPFTNIITEHNTDPLHKHSHFEFHYIARGNGYVILNKRKYSYKPGIFLFAKPGEYHNLFLKDLNDSVLKYVIKVNFENKERDLKEILLNTNTSERLLNIGIDKILLFQEIKDRLNSSIHLIKCAGEHQFLSLLYSLMATRKELRIDHNTPDTFLEKTFTIMYENIRDNLHVQDIANKLNVNQKYFIRLFKRRMGVSPKSFYNKLRIDLSIRMLLSGKLSVRELADYFGFPNQFAFSRLFKQFKGSSPLIIKNYINIKNNFD